MVERRWYGDPPQWSSIPIIRVMCLPLMGKQCRNSQLPWAHSLGLLMVERITIRTPEDFTTVMKPMRSAIRKSLPLATSILHMKYTVEDVDLPWLSNAALVHKYVIHIYFKPISCGAGFGKPRHSWKYAPSLFLHGKACSHPRKCFHVLLTCCRNNFPVCFLVFTCGCLKLFHENYTANSDKTRRFMDEAQPRHQLSFTPAFQEEGHKPAWYPFQAQFCFGSPNLTEKMF